VTFIFCIVIETAKLGCFSMCYVVKLKAFLMQHCCETLCAREMMQEAELWFVIAMTVSQ